MNYPDTCPACGAPFHRRETSGPRLCYACGSWMKEGSDGITYRTDECWDRQAIREAAAIIREMVDEWGSEMGNAFCKRVEEWMKDNEP